MRTALFIQGIFYILTGLWPFISMRSFEAVTGPKVDKWLLKTVSVLIICSGIIMLYSSTRNSPIPFETIMLATLNAIGLTGIDIYYVAIKRIRSVYLADAFLEICFCLFYLSQVIK